MWHLYVSSIDGGYWRSYLVVNTGNVVRYPDCINCAMVVRVGDQSNFCAKMMCSAMVGELITEFSACISYCDVSILSIVHSVDNPLVPCKLIFFLYKI